MARSPRETLVISQRRQTVADLYVQGWVQTAIANELSVTQSTVSADLKAIQAQWRESAVRDFDLARAVELRKLDRLEREAWSSWEQSKKPAQSAVMTVDGQQQKTKKMVKEQHGDPRYLELIQRCISSRRALLGIDAPVRIAPTSPDGSQPYHAYVMGELMRLAEQSQGGPVVVDAEFIRQRITASDPENPTNLPTPNSPLATPSEALVAAHLAQDPLRFIASCWPGVVVYSKQLEVLLSVRDNIETFVPAANQTGKTWIAAMIAIWWFLSRTPARVILSSASESQLRSILWNEILHLIATSVYPLPFRVSSLRIEKVKNLETQETEARDYIIGHVANAVESFQGHHLPNDRPRVLAIFDEASGVPDAFYDAAGSWRHRMLVIGNPLSTTNFFYRLCKLGDVPDPAGQSTLLRKVIHIDGRDSPNVQLGRQWKETGKEGPPPLLIPGLLTYEEYVRREQEWDEVQRTARLHGRFYEGSLALLVPSGWLDRAMDRRRWEALGKQKRQAQAMGIDVAAGGRDKTCWTIIDDLGVIEQIVMDTPNTMTICGRTIRLMRKYDVLPEYVAIDAGGGGKQIADRLIEQGYDVRIVPFGGRAETSHAYRNCRAEMYGKLRQLLDPDGSTSVFALPPNAHDLRRELSVLPLEYDSEGKLMLPPKIDLKKIIGRSPDLSDSLVLAVWALATGESLYCPDMMICAPGEDLETVPADEEPEPETELDRHLDELVAYYNGDHDEDSDLEELGSKKHRHDVDAFALQLAARLSRYR